MDKGVGVWNCCIYLQKFFEKRTLVALMASPCVFHSRKILISFRWMCVIFSVFSSFFARERFFSASLPFLPSYWSRFGSSYCISPESEIFHLGSTLLTILTSTPKFFISVRLFLLYFGPDYGLVQKFENLFGPVRLFLLYWPRLQTFSKIWGIVQQFENLFRNVALRIITGSSSKAKFRLRYFKELVD